jgi:hypothetical protein
VWRDILCVIEERVVGNDNMVAWGGRRLQLPESLRPHFARAKVHALATAGRVWDLRERSAMRKTSDGSTIWTQSKTIFAKYARQSPLWPIRETVRRWPEEHRHEQHEGTGINYPLCRGDRCNPPT